MRGPKKFEVHAGSSGAEVVFKLVADLLPFTGALQV